MGQISDAPPEINPVLEMKGVHAVCVAGGTAGRGCRSLMTGTLVSQLSPANWFLGAGCRQPELKAKHRQQLFRM